MLALGIDALHHDALNTSDIDEVKTQSPSAGSVDAVSSIFVYEPQELLRLAQMRPRKRAAQKLRGKFTEMVSLLLGAPNQPVSIAQRVGSLLGRVVTVICMAPPRRLTWMCFDELTCQVDAHQLPVATDGHLLALGERTLVPMRNRIQCVAKTNVVIGMHLRLGPLGRVESLAGDGLEGSLLVRLELHEGLLARRAVNASARHGGAPANNLALDVLAVEPLLTAEEVVAHVLNLSLHVRLAGRMACDRGVDDEATVFRVLVEGALKAWVVTVGLRDCRFEVVDDDTRRHAAEIVPGLFETLDQVVELLVVRDVNILMPAKHQRDDERVQRPALACLRVVNQTESSEVDLSQLARGAVGHTNRRGLSAKIKMLVGVPA